VALNINKKGGNLMLWYYRNKTTGAQIECECLDFLLYELRTLRGLILPKEVDLALDETGKTSCYAITSEGTLNHVAIEKKSKYGSQGLYSM
jgi:hypothetical protein